MVSEMDWNWDVDLMSYMDLESVIKSPGYGNIKCLWYWNPVFSFTRDLRPLNNDQDVLTIIEDVKGHNIVDVYVERPVEIPDFVETDEVNVEDVQGDEVNVEDVQPDKVNVESDEVNVDDVQAEKVNVESDEVNVDDVQVDKVNVDEDENGTDPDYEPSDEDVDGIDIDLGPDVDVDWTTVLPNDQTKNSSGHNVISDNESFDSDELQTPPESDVEDETERFPIFKNSKMFELGMMFKDKLQVRDAIKEYAMDKKKNVVIRKNDKKRMVVRCMEGCPFYMRFSMRTNNLFWQLVSFTNEHSCYRTPKNRQAKTNWLARNFVYTLRHSLDMKTKGLIAEAMLKWGVKLSSDQAYRAKRKAIELIHGAGREQFTHLRRYAEELLKSNPNSMVKIQCAVSDGGPVFERIYVCLEACKATFATTCKPLIGLDAFFLKGEFGGQLISAVGKDGNNKMMPIAYAVMEAETKNSWQWFIKLLLKDLQSIHHKVYGFISDQQKSKQYYFMSKHYVIAMAESYYNIEYVITGLVPAILETSQHVEHRLCVKHLYGNWRKKYPGLEMKEALWRAARATTIPGWERAMNHMKELNVKAWKDMMDVPAACWSRSHFKTDTHSDLQVNNMCEAFNRAILEYRDKPIISLLEGIKHYLTLRIATQKESLGRFKGIITPKIQQVLEKTKREAEGWSATWHSDDDFALFGVSNGVETYAVNLLQKKCGCRKWDLTGIPCCHAIACIWRSTVMDTYSHIILPTNYPQLWANDKNEPIQPPVMRRAIGRPKKNRNKTNDEPRSTQTLPRKLQTVKCQNCGKMGHNKRTCKGKRAAERVIPKGGNKKVKTKGGGQTVIEGGSQAPRPTQ
ncbi:uncharacterized protein LOC131604807 [Vicia villosa]|uniref:uncharacterized protein LOC131604807 n=1 Tax=Vicia villosa TaxID=3911 RepID=UPI00273BFE26|nr:uncharacterized protein LOC131604807 [Vicia villosa]